MWIDDKGLKDWSCEKQPEHGEAVMPSHSPLVLLHRLRHIDIIEK